MRRVRNQRRSGDVVTGQTANFNRRKTKGIEGDHLIQCDITGQVCLRSEARMTWRGLLVSKQNWDPKHPQLTIIVPPEDISVRDVRSFKGSDGGGLSVADYQDDPSGSWTDDVNTLSDYLINVRQAINYWPFDETTGTTYEDLGSRNNQLTSVADASTINLSGSTEFTSTTPFAKDIDTSTDNAINVVGNNTTAGTLLSSNDTLGFTMKRAAEVDTTILSYTQVSDGALKQYKIVGGSELNITVLEGDLSTETTYTLIPDTNFMVDQWNMVIITFNSPNEIITYVNGILRSIFSFPSLAGGTGGNFKIGGDINPLTAAIDLQIDDTFILGGIITQSEITDIHHSWVEGFPYGSPISVGLDSQALAIANQESTHTTGTLATRTVITSSKYIAYNLQFGSDTSVTINIVEGTLLNLQIYEGPTGGPYTLQITYSAVHTIFNNEFTYSLTTSTEVFFVFKGLSSNRPIQFNTISTSSFVESVTSLAPVNWWRLNETSGTGLIGTDSGSLNQPLNYQIDASTSGYDIDPSSSFTDTESRAKQFPGSSDRVLVPANNGEGGLIGAVGTIEFAWNPDTDASATGGVVVLNRAENFGTSYNQDWRFQQEGNTNLNFRFWWNNGASQNQNLTIAALANYNVASWNYVSLTFDFTTLKTINVRINNTQTSDTDISSFGAIDNFFASGGARIGVGGQPRLIGSANAQAGIDEVQIYTKVLTDDERTQNYNFWATGANT